MNDHSAPSLLLPARIEQRIRELDGHLNELREIDVGTYSDNDKQILVALQARIRDTLERSFGYNTPRYNRFDGAGRLYEPMRPVGIFRRRSALEALLREEVRENIVRALGLLQSAQASLRADLADAMHQRPLPSSGKPLSRRVFVAHGRDGDARERVASFLRKLSFEPIILHEQADLGRTVIEKVEAYGDVDFAVVLLTPDDQGCTKGEKLEPRARQNVLLELGYFLGHLGRHRVCALKRGELQIPSDFAGVVWKNMDDGNGWHLELARELKAAGHEVDVNKAL
ncbi:TIR domain-containing protein [Paraburkholderia sp. RL17-373-BIF-A]|uniref:TIR domain-containing protein n=1 Tax=Paraburkholderia sp. RL17-373-BIF-A TaxID=3031629 RepID=UPI0038BCFBBA